MKIVVTGAIGHIGSYLIRDLAIQFPTADIVMIDNMMTQRYSTLFNLPKGHKFKFIEADVLNYDFSNILNNNDVLFNCAPILSAIVLQ